MKKIHPRYPSVKLKKRLRKRDGFIGQVPDDGYFCFIVSNKAICFVCHKAFDRRNRNGYIETCPNCGKNTVKVNPMTRVPRKQNKRGWKMLQNLIIPK